MEGSLTGEPAPVAFRGATPADAERLARSGFEGMEGYRSFAPAGWAPPSIGAEVTHARTLLADPEVWCLVAEADGEVVGQISVLPADRAAHPVDEPGLGHVRNLFVREDHWGTGLASTLHAAAVAEAEARGFRELRLFVAAGQARARRFYEREGWAAAVEPYDEPPLGLPVVEYRRPLTPRP